MVCNKFEAEMPDVVSPTPAAVRSLQGTGTTPFALQWEHFANGNFSSSQNLQIKGLPHFT
jgi:hypothetical protein